MQPTTIRERMIARHHTHPLNPNQCGSMLTQSIRVPLPVVWSLVRDFSRPQTYKRFLRSCHLSSGEGGPGSVRKVTVASGLPAGMSTEVLERLDDECHVMVMRIIGGDHKLVNYRSTVTLHEEEDNGGTHTVVMESYVVDVPRDSCEADTCLFANTIIGLNLKSLAGVAERMAGGGAAN